ncbi:MAG: bifunctional 5,10-methylenetetrahydrofolate dehydrogenase/5,10-methenyltetrahydrofolate cyclohydrolase [Planctomycetes bacterium]|nr:bifunctional 5,10-methylenetetrahydrofolate dehydrogenase/5,10-methenyltetrahydrofolate cyclohydrolase [Planctomycetota bacterium]MBI3844449.1 bifunctional 5,10-methylenetetrahydrofolate dehydrogenase/5,10-methenyltetrahydrofolate cyclohydrolase [Planctomycetota bacterium]
MSAKRIDGLSLAKRIREQVRQQALRLGARGVVPQLVALQVGDHPESTAYVESQRRYAASAAIQFTSRRLAGGVSHADVCREIRALNENAAVHGIFVALPLSDGHDDAALQAEIDPDKDVEGVTPTNLGRLVAGHPAIVPCTAAAVLALLDSEAIALEGMEAVVVGHSAIVGKPVALLLLDRFASVSVCHVKTRDLPSHTRRAELLVVAVGKPRLVTSDMIRPGAVVIDVGTTLERGSDGKPTLAGDVEPEGAARVASRVTPVPGGVGAVTVAMLLRNVVAAAARAAEAKR